MKKLQAVINRQIRLGAAALAVVLAVLVGFGGAAHAEPVSKLTDRVTDQSEILTDQQRQMLQMAIQDLENTTGLKAYVVYVQTTDAVSPEQWAADAAKESGLSGNTPVVITFAKQDGRVGIACSSQFPVSKSDLDSILENSATPAMANNDWYSAATNVLASMKNIAVSQGVTPDSAKQDSTTTTPITQISGMDSQFWMYVAGASILALVLTVLLVGMARKRQPQAMNERRSTKLRQDPFATAEDKLVSHP